jgi:oligopeptide/dipeptide ABC transporter ATP-binding protein
MSKHELFSEIKTALVEFDVDLVKVKAQEALDLGVVAETCDRVQVMYGGRIVESADTGSLFNDASHPYTKGLLESMPRRTTRKGELRAIRGTVPDLEQRPAGCAFHPRCTHVMDVCRSDVPTPVERTPTHAVSCHLTADPEWSAQ